MTDLRQAAQQALEALESGDWYIDQLEMIVYLADDTGTHEERAKVQAAITALRAALAEPEQEPVAWLYRDAWGTMKLSQTLPPPVGAFPVYTAPTPRQWVGLTDAELAELSDAKLGSYDLCLEVEAKLKEKNHE